MANRDSDPPNAGVDRPSRETARAGRLTPDQYELKIRWERARRVLEVSASGVTFDFDSALKVGVKYPVTLTAPGVSISSTLEVSRCRLRVEPGAGKLFRVEGRFYPYVE